MERVNVYIDAFNFYYGLKNMMQVDSDWRKFYWIDFFKLFDLFMQQPQQLQKVYYFTTPPNNVLKRARQQLLLQANRQVNSNKFEFVKGKFVDKHMICPVCNANYTVPEEKRTDVNISIRMINDCALDVTDTLILVTADSDLLSTVQFINQNHHAKNVRVFFPPQCFSYDLNNYVKRNGGKVVKLAHSKGKFVSSVMTDVVSSGSNSYAIPPEWKVT
jgi:hypothetical protein